MTSSGDAPKSGNNAHLAANAIRFGRLLRRAGLAVDPEQTRLFLRAMLIMGLRRKSDIKAAGRAIYVGRCEERATYDLAFEAFWRTPGMPGEINRRFPQLRQRNFRETGQSVAPDASDLETAEVVTPILLRAPSDQEWLRRADFGSLSAAEARDAQAMLDALRPQLPKRRARRRRVGRHGRQLAARLMLRRSLATGGESLRWRWLQRRTRPRPIVLICDISGSMERYSRFLLRFGHALEQSGAPVEMFVFGTRLTRITRELRVRSPELALRSVAEKVVDWSGGTRIGESLHTLNRLWVRRTIKSSAIVLIASDGWERGDPAVLEREMATLRRSCHRLYWLDPLASRAGFEPLTAGLRAALPYVDALVPCASIASLETLADEIVRSEK